MMSKIKHNKIKNTGILFELLTRQVTMEILNGGTGDKSKSILKEFFSHGTELNKELRLYEAVVKARYTKEGTAEKFLDSVISARDSINKSALNQEKYDLIRKISETYDLQSFLKSSIGNYRTLASIYKVFEYGKSKEANVIKEIFDSRNTLIEGIISKPTEDHVRRIVENSPIIETFKKQDLDLRLITYKLLIETFNKKYSTLEPRQKTLLKEYINNVSNTGNFEAYLKTQIESTIDEIEKMKPVIKDPVTVIKLNETNEVLKKLSETKKFTDSHVSGMMMVYELIKELKQA